jgi:phenylpropionate dioxygenase-like ring-hydroxylating dioxygenase large terminal subunit
VVPPSTLGGDFVGESLFTDELLRSFDQSILPVNEARLLPPTLYTSEQFYEFELSAIFLREWLCLGRIDQVANPGDYYTITIADEPLIVVRGRDQEIRVLSAVCQHRGMVVAEDSGRCRQFQCPYHHWTYALDGSLVGAPAMDRAVGFNKSDVALPSLKVEVWSGFIFANFDYDAVPLSPGLAKIEPILEHFQLDSATTVQGDTLSGLPWNWKIMMENFNDPYHASRLHGPLQTFAPSHLNDFLEWDDTDGAIGRIQHFTEIDGSFNPTKKCLLPVFPDLTEDERRRGSFILVPPTLALAVVPDEVAYFIICPEGAGGITIHIGYCFDPSALKDPMFEYLFEAANAGVNNFNVQDLYADKMVQRGMRSRFGPRGRYSWQEETLRQFNRWLVARYRRHWPGRPGSELGPALTDPASDGMV